jgi:hypothetical protein
LITLVSSSSITIGQSDSAALQYPFLNLSYARLSAA